MDTDRHDIELRGIEDNRLVVSYNHVMSNRTYTEAYHCSDRLSMELLVLFEDGTIAADDLTDEERAWIEADSKRIVFEEGS